MKNNLIKTNFPENIKAEILNHSLIYKISPKAEFLENLFHNALLKSGINSDWVPFNHGAGKDIITNNSRCSIKTGQYGNKNKSTIKYNSYRTTTYKSLKDKLNYFDEQEKNIDYYLFCVPETKVTDNEIKYIYTIYYKDVLTLTSDFIWTETYNKKNKLTGWKGVSLKGKDNIKIIKSMSDQFWCELSIDKFIKITKVYVNVKI